MIYINYFKIIHMVKYICKRCKKNFEHKAAYDRHLNRKNKCEIKKFNSKTNKKEKDHYCKICDKKYSRKDALIQHKKTQLHKNNIKKNKMILGDQNKLINKGDKNNSIYGSRNNLIKKKNFNNNNTTINNNNYYISPFGNEEISKLSTQDKIAILTSNDNPIITIILKTNLNPLIPEYHNVGYIDLKSGYGFIYNGETWEKKEIRTTMNNLLNLKGRDLKKIHGEVSKYLTSEHNKNILNILYDIDNILEPKHEYQIKSKKKLVTNLKTHFYNKRNLINEAIEKSGAPIMELENKYDINMQNVLKDGMTIEELDKILADNRRKAKELAPKKEIAKYIINLINNGQYKKIIEIIENIVDEQSMNVVMRLLCESYYCGNNIDINDIQQKIKNDARANLLINN